MLNLPGYLWLKPEVSIWRKVQNEKVISLKEATKKEPVPFRPEKKRKQVDLEELREILNQSLKKGGEKNEVK